MEHQNKDYREDLKSVTKLYKLYNLYITHTYLKNMVKFVCQK